MTDAAIGFGGDTAAARRGPGRDETVIGLRARVAHLEALVELRDEEIARLRAPFEAADLLVMHLGLTPRQAAMVAVLMAGRTIGREHMATAVYGLADHCPEGKTFDVMLCHIRRKLGPAGIVIETVVGVGWRMPETSRAVILRAIEGAAR